MRNFLSALKTLTLLLLRMLYSSFLVHCPAKVCGRFSLETRAIELKLYHRADSAVVSTGG